MKIKFLVMDVDGTLTDGKIYMGNNGEMFKAFDIKDGCGIKNLLPKKDIVPVIITARKSDILLNRCEEIDITNVYQGVSDKFECLESIINTFKEDGYQYSLKNVAYIGDDIIDLPCMLPIKSAGGLIGCPKDAVKEVIDISDFVSSKDGGNGAVREFIEWIINNCR